MVSNWTYNDTDRRIAEELESFLPEKVFDIHAHVYRVRDLNISDPHFFKEGPGEVTVDTWRECIGRQVGTSRLQGGLFIPAPWKNCDIDALNGFVISQLKNVQGSRGLILVAPGYPRDKVAAFLDEPHIAGFKPYHTLLNRESTMDAALSEFLPEWAWETAHERGLVITLHMVRPLALSDPDNQREIRGMCLKYPNARLVLAHAARGFHSPNTIEGLAALKGIENVWFDTSAICEAAAMIAILREFGPRRLLWGSDFPASEVRGRSVSAGDGFAWLQPDTMNWDSPHVRCSPVLVGLESLRAIRETADVFCLSREDLEDIFCNNAVRLLGLKKEAPGTVQELYRHARQRIPGGTQLLSKRPEMMAPGQWPAYFREARGCETWDTDGKHYYDMYTNGIGACLLGFRDPDVTRAVQRRINMGSMSTLNPPEEVELADMLCSIHPWAQQARFTRSGGEACAAAARIARATTDRSCIAICGYHGWHDWYLAANLGADDALRGHLLPGLDPLGVPVELRGTAVTFTYNNREEFQAMLKNHGPRLAAVMMEPCRHKDPEPGFLEFVREGAHRCGALLIFDEITIGWRLHPGGAHLRYGVSPDIAVFAKALGNGHPIGTVIGTKSAMDGAASSFISSTYWTESVGPAAAVATVRKILALDVPAHVSHIGTMVQDLWRAHGAKHGLPVKVADAFACLANFRFEHECAQELRTLFTQLMLERGFLAGCLIYPTLAHTEEIVNLYGAAVDEVFGEISRSLAAGDVKERLKGPVAHTGFARLL